MSSNTPRQPDELRFLLDANLSYRVSDALQTVELPFLHVSQVPGFGSDITGHSPADDETIAKWCAATGRILVSVDDDFKGRSTRTSLLTTLGAEVLVLSWQPRGLQEQHHAITTFYPRWCETLAQSPSGQRVWIQNRRGAPVLMPGRP